MTERELEISHSTPGYRFDTQHAAPDTPPPDPADDEARERVEAIAHSSEHPFALFALEWCEFCWSVRKVLKALGVDYRSADLDSVEFQANDLGPRMRVALREKTGWNTFPQIFIGGEFLGGCSDLFDGIKDGSVQALLDKHGIDYRRELDMDPYSLLPGWLHPR